MRNALNIKSLALVLFAIMGASTAQAQMSYYLELSNSFNPNKEGHDLNSGLFAVGSYKFSDNWSAAVEWNTKIPVIAGGEFDIDQDHGVLRFPVTRKNLNWLSGWKTSFTTRWTVPTTASAHQAGGFGSLMLRPAFSKEWKPVNLTVRPSLNVSLTDKAYQKFVAPGESPEGVSLFSWALEVYPNFTIAEGLDFQIYTVTSQSYKGGAPGADGEFADVAFSYELTLTNPWVIGGFESWIGLENETAFTKDFNIFDSSTAVINFYISRSF